MIYGGYLSGSRKQGLIRGRFRSSGVIYSNVGCWQDLGGEQGSNAISRRGQKHTGIRE